MQVPRAGDLLAHVGQISGVSRRGFMVRAALLAATYSVAPSTLIKSYAHPGSTCDDGGCGCPCHTGAANCDHSTKCCGEVWTAFCCSLSGSNTCPDGTEIGGYWKCTEYSGNQLCDDTPGDDVRWYLDCNLLPGESCGSGCHCLDGDCSKFRVCCNRFKYGQCHTNHPTPTCIKCRIVRCQRPWEQFSFCDPPPAGGPPIENVTCSHDPGCLPN
jgi:hypothetical protein